MSCLSLRTIGFLHQMTDKVNFFPHHFNFSYHALGKVMAQRQKVRPREGKKQSDKDKWIRLQIHSTGLYEVLAHAGVGERLICTF